VALNAVRERSAVKVARSVLRGPRFREEAGLPSLQGEEDVKIDSLRLNICERIPLPSPTGSLANP
jgi:hypothetical protein